MATTTKTVDFVELIPELRKVFIPMVTERLPDDVVQNSQTNVEFICEMSPAVVRGLMFHLIIDFGKQAINMQELLMINRQLDQFCVLEMDVVEIDGYQFRLGDGDDSDAVFLHDGKFKIWLRGWQPE